MLNFEDDFFNDEMVDGFLVQESMKRYWASGMEILAAIDEICKRHNIKYYAEWGTLLGAIRHQGFVPWDDDIDIGMRRIDYMRFVKYAKEELPDGMFIPYTYEDPKHPSGVVNSNKITTDYAFLEKYHGCPYYTCVDIFVMDNLPDEQEEGDLVKYIWNVGLHLARDWDEKDEIREFTEEEKWNMLEFFEEGTGQHIERNGDEKRQIAFIVDRMSAMYYDVDTKYGAIVIDFLSKEESLQMIPLELLDEIIEVPFYNMMIPVPKRYDEFLTIRYGDWKKPVRGTGDHPYPCFEDQYKLLRDKYVELGIEMPSKFVWRDDERSRP
ncbi:MAG: LicD family protein [Lachnospiraceae bacterium]|nr:LicD family protein [Lachnospiraceae bacterium]